MAGKPHTGGRLSFLAWLCVGTAEGSFLFFMNEFIQREDNIYTSGGYRGKKQRRITRSALTLEESRCILLMSNRVPPKG